MKSKDVRPSDGRIEYRWRVDIDAGIEKTALLYDETGRLKGVDYQYARRVITPATGVPRPAA